VYRAMLPAALLAAAAAGLVTPATALADPDRAQTAACDFGREVTNYDYTDIESYFQRVLDRTTGTFHDNFRDALPTLRTKLVGLHAHSDGAVAECTGGDGDGDPRSARLVVNQTVITDETNREPRSGVWTFALTLNRVGDNWLVSDLQNTE
jgi:Mce-associated membrane protein